MLVRMAVLKGKDPQMLLEEMEVIDKQGDVQLHNHFSLFIVYCFQSVDCFVDQLSAAL